MDHQPRGLEHARLEQVLADIRAATEVDATFGGITTPESAGFTITRTCGVRTEVLRDLEIRSGLGLGGKAMSMRSPVWVRDYTLARGITHDYDPEVRTEGLRAIFAVPLTVGEDVRAVIYGALRQDVPLGDRTVRAADLAVRRCARWAVRTGARGIADTAQAAPSATPEVPGTAGEAPGGAVPALQRLRSAHDELVAIADAVTDEELKQRLQDVCARMRSPLQRVTRTPAVHLSPRELAVLTQVAEGCKNSEIAERLEILPGTVRAYLQAAMRKLGTNNRVQTLNAARETGLLP
ncbi:helix-turn-helix transcriptional regulator [Salinifilum aidingensis]